MSNAVAIIASVAPWARSQSCIEISSGTFFAANQSSAPLRGEALPITIGTYCHGIRSRSGPAGNGLRGESCHCARVTGLPSSISATSGCLSCLGSTSSSVTPLRVAASISRP
jgi:hypothetical protein